jgi:hypothetical protein
MGQEGGRGKRLGKRNTSRYSINIIRGIKSKWMPCVKNVAGVE